MRCYPKAKAAPHLAREPRREGWSGLSPLFGPLELHPRTDVVPQDGAATAQAINRPKKIETTLVRHQHFIDDQDDAIALHHVSNRHFRGAAFLVHDHKILAATGDR